MIYPARRCRREAPLTIAIAIVAMVPWPLK
jgi:hypothetical protein